MLHIICNICKIRYVDVCVFVTLCAVLIHNILHLASQLADNLILATGGVLPVLASATSPSFELDVVEPSEGLSLRNAWILLDRLMIVVDLTLSLNQQNYPNVISINEIENEKAMQNGGILRQFLRLIAVTAVRNSLETRYSMGIEGMRSQNFDFKLASQAKVVIIFEQP